MISKVVPAHSFYHTCRYISQKQGAEVLLAEGVRGHDYKLMAEDFIGQQQLRPSKKLACFHGILSFYPGENPSRETMKEIARKYLERLGIVDTQYVVSKHTDRAHLHLHLVANLVNNNGKAISDSYLGLRGKKIAQQLTKEYKLTPALEKNLRLTHLENLSETEAQRYKVYISISESLPHCRNLEQLERQLLARGIQTLYKYKGQTEEKQGVSFKTGAFCFKGSEVDRRFSLMNLQKTLALSQGQRLQTLTADERALREKTPGMPAHSLQATPTNELPKQLAKGVEKILDTLLQPSFHREEVPNELLKENRKKKQKRPPRPNW